MIASATPETAISPRITIIPCEPVFGLDSVFVLLEEVLLAAVVVFAAVVVLAVVVLAVVVFAVVVYVVALVVLEALVVVVVVAVPFSESTSPVIRVVSVTSDSLAVVSEEVVVVSVVDSSV